MIEPAIAEAHATELAQVNSGLLVLGNDIGLIPESRRLAAKTRRVIRQNLAWALLYNVLLLPLAAGVAMPLWGIRVPPALAAAHGEVVAALIGMGRPVGVNDPIPADAIEAVGERFDALIEVEAARRATGAAGCASGTGSASSLSCSRESVSMKVYPVMQPSWKLTISAPSSTARRAKASIREKL